ncbi:hypothetical protein L596_012804 [Steinernema carpocapsae]|nr:hypothetical protein L596_012804 [Steinernema carpocapsae]
MPRAMNWEKLEANRRRRTLRRSSTVSSDGQERLLARIRANEAKKSAGGASRNAEASEEVDVEPRAEATQESRLEFAEAAAETRASTDSPVVPPSRRSEALNDLLRPRSFAQHKPPRFTQSSSDYSETLPLPVADISASEIEVPEMQPLEEATPSLVYIKQESTEVVQSSYEKLPVAKRRARKSGGRRGKTKKPAADDFRWTIKKLLRKRNENKGITPSYSISKKALEVMNNLTKDVFTRLRRIRCAPPPQQTPAEDPRRQLSSDRHEAPPPRGPRLLCDEGRPEGSEGCSRIFLNSCVCRSLFGV